MSILIILIIIFLVVAFRYWQRHYYFFQYLYFLRAPVLVALLMLFFPVLAVTKLMHICGNWFELDYFGLALVAFLTAFLSWIVMYRFWGVYLYAGPRNELCFRRQDNYEERKKPRAQRHYTNRLPDFMQAYWFGVIPKRLMGFLLLSVSILGVSYWRSPGAVGAKLLAIGSGVAAALVLWKISSGLLRLTVWLRTRVSRKGAFYRPETVGKRLARWARPAGELLLSARVVRSLNKGMAGSSSYPGYSTPRHAAYLFSTLLVYAAGWQVLAPGAGPWAGVVPALAYILLSLMLLAWILPSLTLRFDRYRVPILFLLVGLPMSVSQFIDTEYYYQLVPQPQKPGAVVDAPDSRQVYAAWAQAYPASQQSVLTVVAASGGGITAASWSAQVMTGLVTELGDPALEQDLLSSIVFISAVSGGSLGMMYFVDRYDAGGMRQAAPEIRGAAAHSSLGAVGWGMVYPDFWRTWLGVPFGRDRAWAQEQRWAQYLREPAQRLRASYSWLHAPAQNDEHARARWRPVLAFNATISETGELFVISPMRFTSDPSTASLAVHAPSTLASLYPQTDIAMVTAVRLSATFPYVSPLARPAFPPGYESRHRPAAYHLADGGYYDNFGVLSAVRFLRDNLPRMQHRKILFIQIRASDSARRAQPGQIGTITEKFSGPLDTMLNVRTPSQLIRNARELHALREESAQRGIELNSVVFELRHKSPLSWHLSTKEQKRIEGFWRHDADIRNALQEVRQFLQEASPGAAGL